MSRITLIAVATLVIAGCDGREVVPLQYVDLPTDHSCYLYGPSYFLVADPSLGVAVTMGALDGSRYAVYWPKGYTAHRVGAEVEISKPFGSVVAVTGREYMIPRVPGADDDRIIGSCAVHLNQQ